MRPRPSVRLLLALLAAALALPAAADAAPGLKANLKGVQIGAVLPDVPDTVADQELATAAKLGARVVRSSIEWSFIEPQAGTIDEAYLAKGDHLMAEARKRHIKVFLTLIGSPCWSTTAPAPDCSTDAGRQDAAAYPPADDQAFARIAALVAARWQGDLAALEIWNEPDQRNELYWKGPDKVQRYADLLKATYPAVKAAAPGVPVAGAGIVGGNGKFLQALYDAGIKGSYDVLSVHYYDLVLLSLGEIRKVRAANHDTTPMWLGEFGWTSCLTRTRKTQDQHICVDRATQAQNLTDALGELRRQKDVVGAIIYAIRDNNQYDFGLLDAAGRPKPAFAAMSRAFHGHLGRQRALKLGVTRSRGHLVAAGSGPGGDAFLLEAARGGQVVYRVAFRGDRFNGFRLALPAAIGTSGLKITVRRYSVARGAVVRRV